jgi:hypothetical protein
MFVAQSYAQLTWRNDSVNRHNFYQGAFVSDLGDAQTSELKPLAIRPDV